MLSAGKGCPKEDVIATASECDEVLKALGKPIRNPQEGAWDGLPNGNPGNGNGEEELMTQFSKITGLCSNSDQPTCGYEIGSQPKAPSG